MKKCEQCGAGEPDRRIGCHKCGVLRGWPARGECRPVCTTMTPEEFRADQAIQWAAMRRRMAQKDDRRQQLDERLKALGREGMMETGTLTGGKAIMDSNDFVAQVTEAMGSEWSFKKEWTKPSRRDKWILKGPMVGTEQMTIQVKERNLKSGTRLDFVPLTHGRYEFGGTIYVIKASPFDDVKRVVAAVKNRCVSAEYKSYLQAQSDQEAKHKAEAAEAKKRNHSLVEKLSNEFVDLSPTYEMGLQTIQRWKDYWRGGITCNIEYNNALSDVLKSLVVNDDRIRMTVDVPADVGVEILRLVTALRKKVAS